jgi:hypothetical protein
MRYVKVIILIKSGLACIIHLSVFMLYFFEMQQQFGGEKQSMFYEGRKA